MTNGIGWECSTCGQRFTGGRDPHQYRVQRARHLKSKRHLKAREQAKAAEVAGQRA